MLPPSRYLILAQHKSRKKEKISSEYEPSLRTIMDKMESGNSVGQVILFITSMIYNRIDSDSEDRTISATAKFNNGSTWVADFSFKAFKEPEYKYYDRNDWLSCSGKEWYSLPSGNMVCHVKAISKYETRRDTCQKVGGFLAEITSRADAQTLLYIIYKLNKAGDKSTNMFAVGAMAQNGRWVWENSGLDVELGIGKLLKPIDDTVDLFPYPDTFLYLSLYNPPSSSKNDYMTDIPYFDLFAHPAGDAEEEYLCMKKGRSEWCLIFIRIML